MWRLAKQETVQLTKRERKELVGFFEQLDNRMLKSVFEAISMMVRAFEGKPIEPQDIITKLTNVKNILERSRFPTYPLLAKQVYLRLIAKYNPQASPCKDWADLEAEALISYKGQSRSEFVDMTKAATAAQEQQQFYLGETRLAQPPKRRFWQRKPKQESEFIAQ